jgi:hypothetical protein
MCLVQPLEAAAVDCDLSRKPNRRGMEGRSEVIFTQDSDSPRLAAANPYRGSSRARGRVVRMTLGVSPAGEFFSCLGNLDLG